jgi:hypothetical protein
MLISLIGNIWGKRHKLRKSYSPKGIGSFEDESKVYQSSTR